MKIQLLKNNIQDSITKKTKRYDDVVGERKRKRKERMTHREHIIALFSTHSVLLEGSRQDDSTYILEEHQMRL
jgi:hypothetical protein